MRERMRATKRRITRHTAAAMTVEPSRPDFDTVNAFGYSTVAKYCSQMTVSKSAFGYLGSAYFTM
jgi:hypothetical protein